MIKESETLDRGESGGEVTRWWGDRRRASSERRESTRRRLSRGGASAGGWSRQSWERRWRRWGREGGPPARIRSPLQRGGGGGGGGSPRRWSDPATARSWLIRSDSRGRRRLRVSGSLKGSMRWRERERSDGVEFRWVRVSVGIYEFGGAGPTYTQLSSLVVVEGSPMHSFGLT